MTSKNKASKKTRYIGIDPSTKTGLVILDGEGEVLISEEIRVEPKNDPERMIAIVNEIRSYLISETDKVVIEGFAFAARGRAIDFQFGLGWLIRAMLYQKRIPYVEVAPTTLKSFATGNGKSDKKAIVGAAERDGFITHSDNIADAYFLAKVCQSAIDESIYMELNTKQQTIINKLRAKIKSYKQ